MGSQVLFLFPFSLLTCFPGYVTLLRGEYQAALCGKSTKSAVSVYIYCYKKCRHLIKSTCVLVCLVSGFPPPEKYVSIICGVSGFLGFLKQVHNWIPQKADWKNEGAVLLRWGAGAHNRDQGRSKNTLSWNFGQVLHNVKPCLRQQNTLVPFSESLSLIWVPKILIIFT